MALTSRTYTPIHHEFPTNLTLCHSRVSGNPVAFAGFLDSRLRGNDGIYSLSKCHSGLIRVFTLFLTQYLEAPRQAVTLLIDDREDMDAGRDIECLLMKGLGRA